MPPPLAPGRASQPKADSCQGKNVSLLVSPENFGIRFPLEAS
uniref:Uncharacterized protein n=1 Tax=Arundo donax TaxID=35708 RepID=A0A0A9C9C3_ARUDO